MHTPNINHQATIGLFFVNVHYVFITIIVCFDYGFFIYVCLFTIQYVNDFILVLIHESLSVLCILKTAERN